MAMNMQEDLERRQLRVTLRWIDGGYSAVRVVDEQNPAWYRQFCADHAPSKRRGWDRPNARRRTYIKRQHTLRGLGELASGKCETVYAHRLFPYVKEVLERLPKTGYTIP